MKILVTGANGFVGAPLCAELQRQGQQVRAALRTPGQLSANGETAIVGSVDAGTQWGEALKGVDTVIHLAARVHVMKDKVADPLTEYLKVNLYGTANLARQAADAGVKRLVYASTIKVNGETTGKVNGEGAGVKPYTETDEPDPRDPYAVSKLQAEEVLQKISAETGMEAVVVRPPLVYGPRVKGNFLSLLEALDKGIPLPLAGANRPRSMVYVANLVDALALCATHPAAAGQTYLVSDGEDVSTAMLVEKLCALLGRRNRSFDLPAGLLRAAATLLGKADQLDRLFGELRVNDQKLRVQLGWRPPYTLEQGLRATVDWFRNERPR